jgi:hypothetical protein
MKDLFEAFPELNQNHHRCHLIKRMIDKDFVAYTEFGNLENIIRW